MRVPLHFFVNAEKKLYIFYPVFHLFFPNELQGRLKDRNGIAWEVLRIVVRLDLQNKICCPSSRRWAAFSRLVDGETKIILPLLVLPLLSY